MKLLFNIKKILLGTFLLNAFSGYAAKEVTTSAASTKTGAAVTLNSSTVLFTQDSKYAAYLNNLTYAPSTPWYGQAAGASSGSFYDKQIKNRVMLSIDHTDNKFVGVDYSVVVSFDLTYKKYVSGVFQSFTESRQLTVFNYLSAAVSNDKEVYEYDGGNEMVVKVTNIAISPGGPSISNARILLETEIDIERCYYFDATANYNYLNLTHCSADMSAKGELEVSWLTVEGAEEYELEWTHISNYAGTKTGSAYDAVTASALTFDEKLFDLNATRITTANTFFRIPYVYESGYILYRVRAMGKTPLNGWTYLVPAGWSTDMNAVSAPTNVSLFHNKFPDSSLSGGCNTNENFTSLSDHLNWQSGISFAEEGKSKAVVNFADASLRSRQNITKLKSKNDIVIGETIYDFQGRPAINVLPVPTSNQKIEYVPALNQNSVSASYSKEDFDYDQSGCVTSAPAFTTSSGAANYYSPSNPVLTNENRFIPNAYGYAFSQTEFTPDNTGRIRSQSGLGPDHKLGSGHETKYLYGIPYQKDLDRLFASEVGFDLRYKKNIVIDPNGQASVTYLDPSGKTIATALAGNTPTNVVAVSPADTLPETYDLINKINPTDNSGINNILDLPNHHLSLTKSLLVPSTGPYTFTYTVIPPKFVESCGDTILIPPSSTVTTSGTKCYNCVLDAKISLLNECGQELFSQIFPATPSATNFTTTGTRDTTCSGGTQPAFTATFTPYNISNPANTALLQAGSYSLEKTLTVNQAALDVYTRNYMDSLQNTCILTLGDFTAAQTASIDLSGCGMTCETCNTKLGPASNYTTVATCTVCLTQAEYDALKAQCDELCKTTSDKCENALTILEADVNPTGQYGQYSPGGGSTGNGNISPPQPASIQPWLFPVSVFNENNYLPLKTSITNDFTITANATYTNSYSSWSTYMGYKPNWHYPYNPAETGSKRFAYLDEYGNIAKVKVEPDGTNYLPMVSPFNLGKVSYNSTTDEYFVEPKFLFNLKDFLDLWETDWAKSLVAYHPEYPLYEQCVIDQLSNDYDDNLTEIDAKNDFKTYLSNVDPSYNTDQFMYPVGTPPSTGTNVAMYSGLVVDPYFQPTGNGYADLSTIRLAMLQYMIDPSSSSNYISIWDAAYRIVHCPNYNPGTVCTNSVMPAGYVFTTDEEWQTFKGMYQSLKQSIQDRVNINYSINQTCYNECIGANPFNPFDNNFYDPSAWTLTYNSSYWGFWGGAPYGFMFWPFVTYTNLSPYYDNHQTCNYARYYYFKDKKPRFPTAKMLMPNALGDVSPPCYDENHNIIPCPQLIGDAINEMSNIADINAYNSCQQCPVSVNFEALLKGLATYSSTTGQQDLTNYSTPVPLTCAPSGSLHKEFTMELAQNLFGSGAPVSTINYVMDNSVSTATYLKGKFTYSGHSNCILHMEMPNLIFPAGTPGVPASYTPFTNVYAFSDVTDFCCVKYTPLNHTFPGSVFTTGVGRFSCQVMVETKPGDPLYVSAANPTFRKITIEGYASCVDFKNCEFQPVCVASKEIRLLQNMMNSLFYSNTSLSIAAAAYSVSPVTLSNAPYAGFLQPDLINTFDEMDSNIGNNLSDPWVWNFVSSTGKQFIGNFAATTSSTVQCSLEIDLNPSSAYNATHIKRLMGIKPSTVTAAPAGAFTAYALLSTGSARAWEVVTGTVSCLSAGQCSKEVTSEFQVNGNTNNDPASLGLAAADCPLNTAGQALQLHGSRGTGCGACGINTYSASYNGGACTLTMTIPTGSDFTFSDVVHIDSIFIDFSQPGYTHFYAIATVTVEVDDVVVTSTILIPGLSSCPLTDGCNTTCAPYNLVTNGDFEQGNTGFYSDYTLDMSSSLSPSNSSLLGLPYAASPYGNKYNVYNIKPVWNGYLHNADHTSYLSVDPVNPPASMPYAQTGNGKALAVRSENITLAYPTVSNGADVWYENVNLTPGSTYTFTAYLKNPTGQPAGNLPYLFCRLFVNNSLVHDTAIACSALDTSKWARARFIFNSGSNGMNTKVSIKAFYVKPALAGGYESDNKNGLDQLFLIDDISLMGCSGVGGPNSVACDIPAPFIEESEDDCVQNALNTALEEGEYNYNFYLDSIRKSFQARYVAKCLDAYEDFFMSCRNTEHHYTLYYYDEAGNLVKTVPPQGVNLIPDSPPVLSQIMHDRMNNTQTVFTTHTYATNYKYNSLNQLVSQSVPDNEALPIWQPQNYTGVPATQTVQSLAFNGNNGVLVSNTGATGYLYVFNQGTNSWSPVSNLSLSNLNDVLYLNSTTVYAIGKDGAVLKTTNSGTTWNFMPFPDVSVELIKMHPVSSGSSEVVVYDRDGNTWASSSSGTVWTKTLNVFGFGPGEQLGDVKIDFTLNTGYAISSMNRIFKFDGTAWAVLAGNNFKGAGMTKVTGEPAGNTVYSLGKDGVILKSTDNGNNWNEVVNVLNTDVIDAEFYGTSARGAVVVKNISTGNGELKTTYNGGVTFSNVSGGPTNIKAISFDQSTHKVYCLDQSGSVSLYPAWSTLTAPGGTYNCIKCIATNSVFVGGNGAVLKQYNGSWSTISTTALGGEDILKIDFKLNGANVEGYVLTGANKIYKYSSASGTFTQVGGLTAGVYTALYASGTNSAVATSSTGLVAKIGGTSGTEAATSSSNTFKSVYVNNTGKVTAVGENSADGFAQINSGDNTLPTPVYNNVSTNITLPQLLSISHSSSGTYLCGVDGTIIKYNGTTGNWETQVTASNTQLNSISVSGSSVVACGKNDAAVTAGSQIIYTGTGAGPWTAVANGTEDFASCSIIGTKVFYVGTNRKIASSAFPPVTLTAITTPAGTESFKALSYNGTNIKAVGQNGMIYGGTTISSSFSPENSFTPPVLNDVKWFDASHVIAVGNSGKILASDNAGGSWSVITNTVHSQNLKAVDMLDANTAIAVGTSSISLKITYSCSGPVCSYSVTPYATHTSSLLTDVSIADGNVIMVSSAGNVFYKAASAGGFSSISITPSATLNSVHLSSAGFAYAVGNAAKLYSITPSALTSVSVAAPGFMGSNNLNSVYFEDNTTGYTAGNSGILAKTINGGASWFSLTPPSTLSSVNINAVVPVDASSIALGGASGTSGGALDNNNEMSSRFYYDRLGRLVASQNSKQYAKDPKTYSYTKYDALGRIQEVGEIKAVTDIETLPNTLNGQISMNDFSSWLSTSGNVFTEMTKTYYDKGIATTSSLPATYDGADVFIQNDFNLRNRVSYMTYQAAAGAYNHATFYDYDIHGNVKTLYQYNAAMPAGNQFKRMDYDYDLVSGKVNTVKYQADAADEFYHQYAYDDDNRITNVYTSKDDVIWDQDAKYFYYRHGPLARTELGQHKVQAVDYAYTINGWIKGVNSNKLAAAADMGGDGLPLSGGSINSFVSEDQAAYSLGYYNNDYNAIVQGSGSPIAANTFFLADNSVANTVKSNSVDLFNGNISCMVKSIRPFMTVGHSTTPQAAMYSYDELNRLVLAKTYQGFSLTNNRFNNTALTDDYKESFSYDANGNLLTLKRYTSAATLMDDFTYQYNTITNGVLKNTNRLGAVQDAVTTSGIPDDVESGQVFSTSNHSLDNYQYDNTGNLIKDDKEEIADIKWTVYGKIREIIRKTSSSLSDLEYTYDAAGNRVSKILKTKASPGVLNANSLWEYTYYVRDAQGNTMEVYQRPQGVSDLYLTEQQVYGSNRLGVLTRYENVTTPVTPTDITAREAGNKSFELSNHLGNVLLVSTDRKLSKESGLGTGIVGAYTAEISLATDYYAFGSPMKRYNAGGNQYRYGFNGKENDIEIKGEGNSYDFGARIYDSRIGKFLSIDRLSKSTPFYSPYIYAGNKPIAAIDANGDIEVIIHIKCYNQDGTISNYEYNVGEITTSEDIKGISRSALHVDVTTGFVRNSSGGFDYVMYGYSLRENTGETDAENMKRNNAFNYYAWYVSGKFMLNNPLGTGQIMMATQDRDPMTGEKRSTTDRVVSLFQGLVDMASLGMASKAGGNTATKFIIESFVDMTIEEGFDALADKIGLSDNQALNFVYYITKFTASASSGELKGMQEFLFASLDTGVKSGEFVNNMYKKFGINIDVKDKNDAAVEGIKKAIPGGLMKRSEVK